MKCKTTGFLASYMDEPSLLFAGEREHVSPQIGLSIFGPYSLDDLKRHPESARLGLIGTGHSIESAKKWIASCVNGVAGDDDHLAFPGFSKERGFYCDVDTDSRWEEPVTQKEISALTAIRSRKERFERTVQLLSEKMKVLTQKDSGPTCILIAMPNELVSLADVADYNDSTRGLVHRDLRLAVKAEAMRYQMPSQLVLQRTTEAEAGAKTVDHKSRCAWNFFTGLYYKLGGIPWSPKKLGPGTCYVGISFHRPLGSKQTGYRTSVAQAFDEHGDSLILRGQDFAWDESKLGSSPHLSEQNAKDLLDLVLKRYSSEMRQVPTRVVIHKTSKYWPEERRGFEAALAGVHQYDFLALWPSERIRGLRDGQYPVLRGTRIEIGDQHLLYTTGFIPSLQSYPHGHIPSPLHVIEHFGDSQVSVLLEEILVLSKMNWNSANFSGLMPITLRFSKLVGNILKEVPADQEPLPQFKYYM